MFIVFDLDDTLIDTSGGITPYKLRDFLAFLRAQGVLFNEKSLWALHQSCKSFQHTLKKVLGQVELAHLLEEAISRYLSPLPPDFVVPQTPRAREVLRILSKRHQIFLVTAGKLCFQVEKLEKAGLEPSFFSKIAISEGGEKASCYQELLREFSISPSQLIAVGDRVEVDLEPAYFLGCQTVHMRWGRGLKEKTKDWINYSIYQLPELLDFL